MSAPAKVEEPVITKEMMQSLKSRRRRRFDDATVKRALAYQYKHGCTLAEAAATEGMTNQTLAARRDALAAKMGVSADDAQAAKKPEPVKKSTKK